MYVVDIALARISKVDVQRCGKNGTGGPDIRRVKRNKSPAHSEEVSIVLRCLNRAIRILVRVLNLIIAHLCRRP